MKDNRAIIIMLETPKQPVTDHSIHAINFESISPHRMRQHLRGILIKVNNNYSEYVTKTTAYLWIKYWSVFCFIS